MSSETGVPVQSQDNASAARSCLIVSLVVAVIVLVACVLIAIGLVFNLEPRNPPMPSPTPTVVAQSDSNLPAMTFSVVDVGQGACVVVITPDGRALVADAGRSQQRVREYVIPFLREHGVEEVDYLVVTNADQDHVGGMPAFLNGMQVAAWLDPVVESTNLTYALSLQLVDELGVLPMRARRGDSIDLGGGVTVDVLWPRDPLLLDGGVESRNDNSIVLKITYGNVAFMITGDISSRAERMLVDHDFEMSLNADVLVVAHHGSAGSSSAAFLDAVEPAVALIPVGLGNMYGHPRDEVMQRLRFRGIRIYRTDLDGTLEVRSTTAAFQVKPLGKEGTP